MSEEIHVHLGFQDCFCTKDVSIVQENTESKAMYTYGFLLLFLPFFNNKKPPPVLIDCHYIAAHACKLLVQYIRGK